MNQGEPGANPLPWASRRTDPASGCGSPQRRLTLDSDKRLLARVLAQGCAFSEREPGSDDE